MRIERTIILLALVIMTLLAIGSANGVPVPFTLSDNRVTITAQIENSVGHAETARAWVDTGNPDLWITANLADRLGLKHLSAEHPSPFGKTYKVELLRAFRIAGYHLIVPKSVRGIAIEAPTIGPGLDAVVNIPATVLSQAEVEFDYMARSLVISVPGSGNHTGIKVPLKLDAETSLISLPAVIDGTACLLGLDTGATYSYLDKGLVARLISAHPGWSHMTGAIGAVNIWGLPDEPTMRVLRIPKLSWGALHLHEIGVGELPGPPQADITPTTVAGVLGGNVLSGFRIDIDYRNHVVYFDKSRYTDTNRLNMVGVVLHPGSDGEYSILKTVDYRGTPAVPSIIPNDRLVAVDGIAVANKTMGQVILALGGKPGQTRKLTLEHSGRTYEVNAVVHRFLP